MKCAKYEDRKINLNSYKVRQNIKSDVAGRCAGPFSLCVRKRHKMHSPMYEKIFKLFRISFFLIYFIVKAKKKLEHTKF